MNEKRLTALLYALQAVGVVFVAVFLAAYLAGLPTTAVLHSNPAVRLFLAGTGAALLIIIAIGLAAYFLARRKA